uniref:Uncharacterized protein n=1 Tax=Rhizophora mucronata TaxID=61149 RepID=A0A2P2NBG4_RHIMU
MLFTFHYFKTKNTKNVNQKQSINSSLIFVYTLVYAVCSFARSIPVAIHQ